MGEGSDLFLERTVRECISEKMKFEQRPECSEGVKRSGI